MADEQEDKPDAETVDGAAESSQETAVGHSVVEEPARETAVGHPVVEADAAPAAADEGTTEVFFSRDEPATRPAAAGTEPAAAPQPAAAPKPDTGGTSPAAADRKAGEDGDPFAQKPELYIGGAFVGAFVLAKLLKKLTGGGD
jgi:hypothetical protein